MRLELSRSRRSQHIALYQNPREGRTAVGCRILAAEKAAYPAYPSVVNCPQDMPDVRLAIGSNAASVWWVNGKEVTGIYGDRQTVIDDGVSKRLTLKKGPNIVRGAIVNGSGASDFCARFLDRDEKPLKGFTLNIGDTK